VRLVGNDGTQFGIVPFPQALHMAEEAGFDLVEVAPMAVPPVCRIMDYGKFKYQKKKRMQEARKRQFVVQIKEVKIRYKTDDHDLATKVRQAGEFLKEGHKVKFVMFFKGREIQFASLGQHVMEKVAADLMEFGNLERPPRMEGRVLSMYFMSKGTVKRTESNDAKDEVE